MKYESIIKEEGVLIASGKEFKFNYDYKVKIDGVTLFVAYKVSNPTSEYVAMEATTMAGVCSGIKKSLSKGKFFDAFLGQLDDKTKGKGCSSLSDIVNNFLELYSKTHLSLWKTVTIM